MTKALEVWSLVWPDGIPPEDYERALLMSQLAKENRHALVDRPRKVRSDKGTKRGSTSKRRPSKAQRLARAANLVKARAARARKLRLVAG